MTDFSTLDNKSEGALGNGNSIIMVRIYHLQAALGLCEAAIQMHLKTGKLPRPDMGGPKKSLMWKLSTLRDFYPPLADAVTPLLKMPLLKIPRKAA